MEKQSFSENSLWAVIKSQNSPTDEQLKKIGEFLNKKYNSDVELSFKKDNSVKNGFKIEIGTLNDRNSVDEIIDWSLEGKTRQLKNKIFEAIKNKHDVIPLIKETIDNLKYKVDDLYHKGVLKTTELYEKGKEKTNDFLDKRRKKSES